MNPALDGFDYNNHHQTGLKDYISSSSSIANYIGYTKGLDLFTR